MGYDVVSLGELLIDFAPHDVSEAGSPLFECNPGGAPANVLTAITRQGQTAAFIGKVGSDLFGSLLRDTLKKNSICSDGLVFDPDVRTTLAFVSLDETGDRSFSFFRNPGADIMLKQSEIRTDLLKDARIFHFGSLSLTHEPARSATRFAVEYAKRHGSVISYDPNLRPPLWPSLDHAKERILEFLPYADIVKLSDEEFGFLTGSGDYQANAAAFAEQYGISCLFVTLGAQGAFCHVNGHQLLCPTYNVKVVDTTGSGDAFIGAALVKLLPYIHDFSLITAEAMRQIMMYANASGSMTATKKGGIPAIPNRTTIEACMNEAALLQ